MTTAPWQAPPESLVLGPDEVHVWCASLKRSESELESMAATLIEKEHERAAGMKEGPIRNEFIAARGLLRTLLSRYLGQPPQTFRFRAGMAGKPYLDGVEPPLYFNVSHSGDVGMLAFATCGEVGVDVERFRPFNNILAVARRWFRPPEVEVLRSLNDADRLDAFFRAWTRKESYLKASGLGLAHGLTRVEVSIAPSDPPRIVFIEGREGEAPTWSVCQLFPTPGYIGAVALQHHDYRLRCWRWPDPS
jgi:4'-phosphopantetheinyl transferase